MTAFHPPFNTASDTAFSAAIIAGGQSTRMGQDKAFMPLAGQPLIGHVLQRVRAVEPSEVLLIANRPALYRGYGVPVYPDVVPGSGSLGGIYSALYHSQRDLVLAVACDMPFLNPDLLRYLLSVAVTPGEDGLPFDAVAPRTEDRPQGLHAIYRRTCLEPMRLQMESGRLSVARLLESVRTRYVDAPEIATCDPHLHSFYNINTPADLAEAERIAANGQR